MSKKKHSNSYKVILQTYIAQYREEHGRDALTLNEVAAWLINTNRWRPPIKSQISELSRDLGEAMRTDYLTDAKGRRVRRNHALKRNIIQPDGTYKQMNFWQEIDIAQPQFMQASFAQRRASVADKLFQLKQDSDSYNENWNKAKPIQISFVFDEDMEERENSGEYPEDDGDF